MEKDIFLKKGTILKCHDCKAHIALVLRDIYRGESMDASQVEGIQKPIRNGDSKRCNCGGSFLYLNAVSTDKGVLF